MVGSKNGGDFDAVVIGAGFSGMGMLRRLRDDMGLSVQVYEAGSGVGERGIGTGTPAPDATPRATPIVSPSRRSFSRNGAGVADTPSSPRF